MAKTKRPPQQVIKVTSYDHDWINHLAMVLNTFAKMEPFERRLALRWIKSTYLADGRPND